MPPVTDSTKVVNVLVRPLGFRCSKGKQATIEEIGKWKEKETPNIILQQSYLTVGGLVTAVIGGILGIIGFIKDSKLGKWSGGILVLLGVIITAVSKFMGIDLKAPDVENYKKEIKEKVKSALAAFKNESLPTNERESAIRTLTRYGELEELNAVINFINDVKLQDDERNHSLRRVAMHSLCGSHRLEKKKKEEILFSRLKDPNEEQDFRKSALNLLRGIGDKSTITSLEEIKKFGIIANLNYDIESAIEQINDRISGKLEKQESQLKKFKDAQNDQEKLRVSIDYIKDKSLLPECRREVIIEIIEIINKIEQPNIIPHLINCAKDKTDDYDVRSAAIIALKEAGKGYEDKQFSQFLKDCVSDKSDDQYVRSKAIEALSSFEKGNAIEYLLPLLSDKTDKYLQRTIIREFGKIGDERTLQILETIARDRSNKEEGEKFPLWFCASKAIDEIRKRLANNKGQSKAANTDEE